jgi:hypothetical protein
MVLVEDNMLRICVEEKRKQNDAYRNQQAILSDPRAAGSSCHLIHKAKVKIDANLKFVKVGSSGVHGSIFLVQISGHNMRHGTLPVRGREYFMSAPWMKVLEICPRGNNENVYCYILVFMINVYIPCYNCVNRKH